MKYFNEIALKFYKKIMLCILLLMLSSDCSISPKIKTIIHNDRINPCGENYPDKVACEEWKKNFPKEYEKYLERQKKNLK